MKLVKKIKPKDLVKINTQNMLYIVKKNIFFAFQVAAILDYGYEVSDYKIMYCEDYTWRDSIIDLHCSVI